VECCAARNKLSLHAVQTVARGRRGPPAFSIPLTHPRCVVGADACSKPLAET